MKHIRSSTPSKEGGSDFFGSANSPSPVLPHKNKAAQKFMFNRRQENSTSKSTSQAVITTDDITESSQTYQPSIWIPELGLSIFDQGVLLSPNSWLTDSLVSAAQKLMVNVNP